jgi:hypothetical protein
METHTKLNPVLLAKAISMPILNLAKYIVPLMIVCGYPIVLLVGFLDKL